MTVEVDTPDGVRSGSSVREVVFKPAGHAIIAQGRDIWRVRGEAVAIDLPNGKTVFALLRGGDTNDVDYGARIPDRALGNITSFGQLAGSSRELYPTAPKSTGLAVGDPLPMLASFENDAVPSSVTLINPRKFSASLGPGYALKKITIQLVDEPVTSGIERRLPWLRGASEASLNPKHGPEDWSAPAMLKQGDFVKR